MQKSDFGSEAKGGGVISYSAYRMKQRQGSETGRVEESTKYTSTATFTSSSSHCHETRNSVGVRARSHRKRCIMFFSLRAMRCSAIFVDAAGARDVAFEFLEEVGKERI